MKINKFLVERATLKDQQGALTLRLKKLEIGRLTNLSQLARSEEVTVLELDGNFLKEIEEPDIRNFLKLEVLTAPMNFLTNVTSLMCLPSLKQLDLSANRLKLLNDMSPLSQLEYLDVSHNQIKYIERLPASLRVFKAGNNLLEEMGFLPPNLQVIDLRQNFIERVSELAQVSSNLRILNLESNQLSRNQFPTLLIILEYIMLECRRYSKNLKELVLLGNELASSENYVLEIINRRQIEKLDHIIVTPYIRKAFTEIKQQRDIEDVIKETHSEYLRRIKDEVQAKEKIIDSLRAKQQQVEQLFSEYRSGNAERLDNFVDYCNKALVKDGKELQYEREVILNFEKKLKAVEENNTFEARSRKRKQLEDQLAIAAAKLEPKKDVYGKPNYKPLPSISEAKQLGIRPKQSESEASEIGEYTRKKPMQQQLEGLYNMLGEGIQQKVSDQSLQLRSGAQVSSAQNVSQGSIQQKQSLQSIKLPRDQIKQLPLPKNQSSSKPSEESSVRKYSKRLSRQPPGTNESSSKPSLQTITSKESEISEQPQLKPIMERKKVSIEKSVIASKRESFSREDSSKKKIHLPPTPNLFSEECWACFEKYYNEIATSKSI